MFQARLFDIILLRIKQILTIIIIECYFLSFILWQVSLKYIFVVVVVVVVLGIRDQNQLHEEKVFKQGLNLILLVRMLTYSVLCIIKC